MKTCANCGQPLKMGDVGIQPCPDFMPDFYSCTPCYEAGEKLQALLEAGIEIVYKDGSKETIKK